MNEKSDLAQKCKDTQEEILASLEKIAPAFVLNFFSGILPKRLSKKNPIYWLLIILAINIAILVPSYLISIIAKEISLFRRLWLPWLLSIQIGITGLIMSYFGVKFAFEEIASRLVDKVNNIEDLSKLRNWLQTSWSIHRMVGYIAVMWFAWFFIGAIGANYLHGEFIGYGLTLVTIAVGFLIAITFYCAIWFYQLSPFLGTLQYELNSISPLHSEAINVLQTINNKYLYLVAVFSAIGTFSLTLVETYLLGIPFVFLGWAVFINQFIANRSTINKIVDEEKWNTLNKIQMQINQIEKNEDLSKKSINKKLFRLVDTYERVRMTSTNKLEAKSIFNFIGQMMLPLLGFLLGNLDRVLDFFK